MSIRTARGLARGAFAALLALSGCAPKDPAERVWVKRCESCHGADGRGRTKFAEGRPYADLRDASWKHGSDLESMKRLISEGDAKSPMPPFKGRLTPEEIDLVARYVLKLSEEPGRREKGAPR